MIFTIDIGTTTCKAALFDSSGELISLASVPVVLSDTQQTGSEIEVLQWARALAELSHKVVKGRTTSAIVVSGNGPTLTPVTGEVKVSQQLLVASAAPARLYLDRRAVVEAHHISQISGIHIDPSFVLPKALYLQRHQQEIYEQTQYFLSSHEYINYLLTGEAKAVLHALDAQHYYWTEELLEELGLDAKKFPPFCLVGDLVGEVTSEAAQTLSLKAGTPVFAGGPDFWPAIIGSGATVVGRVNNRSGTSDGINLCSEHPCPDERLLSYRHPITPYYNVSGIISTTGKAIEWIKNLLGYQKHSFNDFYQMVAQSDQEGEALLFLPYLSGERAPIWDVHAQGVFNGLSLHTDAPQLARSVVEGICLALRDVLTVLEEQCGFITELRVTGGPAESCVLNQIKADATQKEVITCQISEAELSGSMVIAQVALGRFSSLATAAEALIHLKRRYLPDSTRADYYGVLFERYRDTYQRLKEQWHQTGSIERKKF